MGLERAPGRSFPARMTAPSAESSGGAPWLERPDWAARRIGDGTRAGMWFFLGFATLWNAIAWTISVVVFSSSDPAPGAARLVVLLFPLIGLLLLVAAG